MEQTQRVTDQSRNHSIYALAQKGFVANDIIDIKPQDISVVNGVTKVSVNGKVADLDLDSAKNLAKYINANIARIRELGFVFFGKSGKFTKPSVTKVFRLYLSRYQPGITLTDLGWTQASQADAQPPIETIEDITAIFDKLK